MKIIDVFDKQIECEYRGEHCCVRDNGAVYRCSKEGKRQRPLDDTWTFGSLDIQKGYARIGNEPIHRIVATAFLGEPPTPHYVVDHIDTNRQNNRPENLRWLTKLENAMLNEITRKKLEWICGCSIEEIVKDWSIIQNKNLPPNIAWMKTVTKEEVEQSFLTWKKWADSLAQIKENDHTNSLYFKYMNGPNSMVYPLEPIGDGLTLSEYYENLKTGKVFCYKDYKNIRGTFKILDFYLNNETRALSVATSSNSGTKTLFLTTIKLCDGKYEYSTKSFFSPEGLQKYMTLAKGEEWTGGDTIDDYC